MYENKELKRLNHMGIGANWRLQEVLWELKEMEEAKDYSVSSEEGCWEEEDEINDNEEKCIWMD
jgi:hypothetical protein